MSRCSGFNSTIST